MQDCMTHFFIVAVTLCAALKVHAHSCYYFINNDPAGPRCGGRQGSTPDEFSKCVACATKAKPSEPKSYIPCTEKLIDDACHGILPPEPPSSGALKLTLLSKAAQDKGAVCLDGSPAGYYWRQGQGDEKTNFLLVFNGGGWCRGITLEEAKQDCADRATGKLGSSKTWSTHLKQDAHGMTSSNCTINPAFCRWSVAYIYYCDGASFSGDNADPVTVTGAKISPIYFRGKRVLDANLAHLIQVRGLQNATAVVLSGHSAGGLATYLHADYVRTKLPASLAFFAAVPDAGFFLDHSRFGFGDKYFGTGMRTTWALANASGSLNAACTTAHAASPLDCIFPEHFARFIETPLHVTQSQYDLYQLESILQLGCHPPKDNCNSSQLQSFQQYRIDTMSALNASGLYRRRQGHGMWNDACIAHTQGYYGDYMDNHAWEVPAQSGITLARSLEMWLSASMRNGNNTDNVHVDVESWPHNQPCSRSG